MDIRSTLEEGRSTSTEHHSGYYSQEYLDRLRDEIDIVAVINEHIDLKQASADGSQWKGLCPFHADHAPSFQVYVDTSSYYCFGCQTSGDIFTFLMKQKGLTFPQAVRQVRRMTGIDPPDPKEAIADSFSNLGKLADDREDEGYTAEELLLQLSKLLGRFLKDNWHKDWVYQRIESIYEAADIAHEEGDQDRLQRILDRVPDELRELSCKVDDGRDEMDA